MTVWTAFDLALFATGLGSGGALIWFCKDKIQALVIGANALSAKLHAQADAISVTAKKL
jgi:hypothetical protein